MFLTYVSIEKVQNLTDYQYSWYLMRAHRCVRTLIIKHSPERKAREAEPELRRGVSAEA